MVSSSEDCGFYKKGESGQKSEVKDAEVVYINLPLSNNNKCMFCNQMPIDQEVMNVFSKSICRKCKYEKVKFITKTTCRDVYLLCDSEINEFKSLTRPNPHKGTWNDMSLYFESEIKEYAIKKHGSMEAIETIKQTRADNLIERKKKSMKKKMQELKRKTFVKPEKNQKHTHTFTKSGNKKSCKCGLEYEEEEI